MGIVNWIEGKRDLIALIVGSGLGASLLTSYFSYKAEQQKYLDKFIEQVSSLMIDQKFYIIPEKVKAPTTLKATFIPGYKKPEIIRDEPTVPTSAVASAYVRNALQILTSDNPFVNDIPKKQIMLKFLYDFQMIGFCDRKFNPYVCYEARINLEKLSLSKVDFNQVNKVLTGMTLMDVDMSGASFRKTGLPVSSFTYSNLKDANFDETDLRFANLDSTFLMKSSFSKAILIGASLKGAKLCGASLRGANVTDADFTNAIIDSSTDLQGAFYLEDGKTKLLKENLKGKKIKEAGIDVIIKDGKEEKIKCREWEK